MSRHIGSVVFAKSIFGGLLFESTTASESGPHDHALRGENDGMTTIFVGNLSFQTTEPEVRRAFESFGRVNSVRIMNDRNSGSPRGFAFVNMPGMDDAEEAIARLNGNSLGGRSITVNEARSREESGSNGPPVAGRRSALLDLL